MLCKFQMPRQAGGVVGSATRHETAPQILLLYFSKFISVLISTFLTTGHGTASYGSSGIVGNLLRSIPTAVVTSRYLSLEREAQ